MIAQILFLFFIVLVGGTMIYAGFSAAPWVPLGKKQIRRMLQVAGLKRGEKFFDLGAGDGRVVAIAAQEFGAHAIGYEISILPYLFARLRLLFVKNANVSFKNIFSVSMRDADVITVFLMPSGLARLEKKLFSELKQEARVVSYAFKFPNKKPYEVNKPAQNDASIWLYKG